MSPTIRRLATVVALTLAVTGCVTSDNQPEPAAAPAEPAATPDGQGTESGLGALIHLTRCADRLAGIEDGIASCTWLLRNARLTPESRARVLVARGALLAAIGDFPASLIDLDNAETADPRAEGLHLLRAGVRFDLGEYEAGLRDAVAAARLTPDDPRPFALQAQALALLERDDEAVAAVNRALDLDRDFAEALVLRAAIVLRQDDFASAVADFDRAEELGVEAERIAPLRAVAFLRLNEYERAITDLDLALELEPENPEHWMLRGQAHAELGLARPAGRDFDQALELEPDSARILNGVAWAYATAPAPVRDPATAKMHAARAIGIEPRNGYYLDTYAAAFVAMGDYDTAMRHYRRAMEIQPEVPGMYQAYLRNRGLYDGNDDGRPSESLIRAMEQHIRTGCALTDETCEGPDGVRIAG